MRRSIGASEKSKEKVAMEALPEPVVSLVCRKMDAKSTLKLGCTNSYHHRSVSDDEDLWSSFCSQDFAVSSRLDPLGNPCSSFKETYDKWNKAFGMYPLSIVKRAKSCWDRIKKWSENYFPDLRNSLAHGASEEEINKVEDVLGWKLPLSMRVLYRFCNGQSIPASGTRKESYSGLLGGYSFYDHAVNVHLLPLHEVVQLTKEFMSLPFQRISKHAIIAASCRMNKFFFVDSSNGQVYVGTKRLGKKGELMPCVPNSAMNLSFQDSMLLWLEEYSRLLVMGMFSTRNDSGIQRICLFPEKDPLCSRAVTNGVEVRSSALFVPELSKLEDPEDGFYFSYSIRIKLLNDEGVFVDKPLNSCQLCRRHWVIFANDSVIDEVHGEAVIGKYPLLKRGGNAFVYESCTSASSSYLGSIEGDFTFVPGSLWKPEGSEFKVQVARFPLQIPKYIF